MKRLRLHTLLILSFLVSMQAQELGLRFDAFPPTKGTSVGFTISEGGDIPASALAGLPLRSVETQEHKYTLSVDTQTFGRDKYHRFSFDAYVRSALSGGVKKIQKYTVSEDPVGPFRDGVSPVTFHVNGHAGEDVGVISLPLHSDNGSDNIGLALPKGPQKVRMGGPSTLDLGLTNNLDILHVNLNGAEVSSTLCQSCWLSMSAKPNLNDLAARASTSLIVSLRANAIPAFLNTLFSLNPEFAHDKLLISVSSTSEQGGLVTAQEFEVPVRFAPPALYLLAAVIVGALVGSIVRLLISPPPESQLPQSASKRAIKEIGISIFLSALIWVIALALFSYTETRVTIFGFSLDPSQVVPAGLIAVLVAGGPPVLARIKEAFGK